MTLKNYSLAFLFSGISFFSISQYKYSLEVESFNDKHPKEVLDDISQYLDDYNRHINDGIFTFESKNLITEEKINVIVETAGYTVREFKSLSIRKEENPVKNLD